MGWFSRLFSNIGVDLTATVGKVIDDLVTSDEEIALTEVQKLKIQTAYEIEMKALLVRLDKQQAEHERNLEAELTERLQLDMKSDSWLSKNIRPMALIFLTATISILAFFTVFDADLTDAQLRALKEWIPFFSTIMLTVYAFYFGSRGLEKIQKIRAAGAADVEKAKKRQVDLEREPRG
ncbi:hypothetical protein FKG94_16560 [Exilibacterium tricleocarpae]|uniref:Holin of 3TMs, for gene-transfer release n=1 Tax=Exilibacterium tricleocarpae TaxID=2591008 RepID=A0A545TAI2_9GAMM|nr:hypothetical protein [Exilibacterium tricleocarpae]TQV74218.1 hypothetical protein FKG94_16560 [Exilibacterium tricleocarpae]